MSDFPVKPQDPWWWLLSNIALYLLYTIHPDRVVGLLGAINVMCTGSLPMLTSVLYVLELLEDQP